MVDRLFKECLIDIYQGEQTGEVIFDTFCVAPLMTNKNMFLALFYNLRLKVRPGSTCAFEDWRIDRRGHGRKSECYKIGGRFKQDAMERSVFRNGNGN